MIKKLLFNINIYNIFQNIFLSIYSDNPFSFWCNYDNCSTLISLSWHYYSYLFPKISIRKSISNHTVKKRSRHAHLQQEKKNRSNSVSAPSLGGWNRILTGTLFSKSGWLSISNRRVFYTKQKRKLNWFILCSAASHESQA